MTWLFFAVLSPFLHSIANIIDDRLASRRFTDLKSLVFYSSFLDLIFLPIVLLDPHLGFQVSIVGWLVLLGAINIFYLFPYYKALQSDDTSIVASLFALTRLFVPVLAFFFVEERLTTWQYVGFVVIIVASALLTFERKHLKFNKALWYMLIASGMITAESLIFKYLFEQGFSWGTVLGGEMAFSFLWTLVFFLHPGARRAIFKGWKSFNRSLGTFFAGSAFTYGGITVSTYAVSLAPLTLVETVESFQPFFVLAIAVIMGRKAFHEHTNGNGLTKKLLLFVVMLFGIWLMTR